MALGNVRRRLEGRPTMCTSTYRAGLLKSICCSSIRYRRFLLKSTRRDGASSFARSRRTFRVYFNRRAKSFLLPFERLLSRCDRIPRRDSSGDVSSDSASSSVLSLRFGVLRRTCPPGISSSTLSGKPLADSLSAAIACFSSPHPCQLEYRILTYSWILPPFPRNSQPPH